MKKVQFIIPVGISGSGKSRWIRLMQDTTKNLSIDEFVVVCPDEIRKELTGSISDQSRNKDVFPLAFERTVAALNAEKSVIFDATNVTSKTRKSMLDFLKENAVVDFDALAKVFEADPKICKERVAKDIAEGVDRSNVPPEAIDRQYGNFIADLDKIEADGYILMK
jgi:predicted kinase